MKKGGAGLGHHRCSPFLDIEWGRRDRSVISPFAAREAGWGVRSVISPFPDREGGWGVRSLRRKRRDLAEAGDHAGDDLQGLLDLGGRVLHAHAEAQVAVGTPIARRTCEGANVAEAQAEPEAAAMPCTSRLRTIASPST